MYKFLSNKDIVENTMPANNYSLLRIGKSGEKRLHLDNNQFCINFIQDNTEIDRYIASRFRSILSFKYQDDESPLPGIWYLPIAICFRPYFFWHESVLPYHRWYGWIILFWSGVLGFVICNAKITDLDSLYIMLHRSDVIIRWFEEPRPLNAKEFDHSRFKTDASSWCQSYLGAKNVQFMIYYAVWWLMIQSCWCHYWQ